MEQKGLVFDIQRYSIHDGPGIRTLIFMKGCPLRCIWCANPEGISAKPIIMYREKECYGCGACIEKCESKAIKIIPEDQSIQWDRSLCTNCLKCAEICKISHARKICGEKYTIDQLLEIIDRDRAYYYRSGGGVTIGGGEPLLQSEFVSNLLIECKEQLQINTAIETSSYGSWECAYKVYKYADTIQTDIKHMDDDIHQKLTGVSNKSILDNIAHIAEILDRDCQTLVIRIPVITGYNDSDKNIVETARFVKALKNAARLELLPYHNLGEMKYNRIAGKNGYKLHGLKYESESYMEHLKDLVENEGVACNIGGL